MFLYHVIVEYKESHCFCFLVSEDGTLEPVSTHLRLLSQQLIFHRSLFLYRHSFLVFFEILSFPGLKVEPRVSEGTNLRQQSLDKRMEFILKGKQRKLRTTSEASHPGGGQKGNEGPRHAQRRSWSSSVKSPLMGWVFCVIRSKVSAAATSSVHTCFCRPSVWRRRVHLLDLASTPHRFRNHGLPGLDGAENCPFWHFFFSLHQHSKKKTLKNISQCVNNRQHVGVTFWIEITKLLMMFQVVKFHLCWSYFSSLRWFKHT